MGYCGFRNAYLSADLIPYNNFGKEPNGRGKVLFILRKYLTGTDLAGRFFVKFIIHKLMIN